MNCKKYFVLLSLPLLIAFSSSFISSEKLDFTTEVIQISDNTIEVVVTILSGEPEFTYSIWDTEPWENGNELENSGTIQSTEYTFRNLLSKPYFVVVSDKNGLKRIKQVQLPTSTNIQSGRSGH